MHFFIGKLYIPFSPEFSPIKCRLTSKQGYNNHLYQLYKLSIRWFFHHFCSRWQHYIS